MDRRPEHKATVIVTHDQLEALTMADRIAVMRAGRIEQIASPHAIFARPQNLFVAGFIGTPQMNLIEAVVDRVSSNEMRFRSGSQQVSLPVAAADSRLPEGAKVTLGIRPRAFELVPEADTTTLSAKVDMVEPMGAETLLHLQADGRDLRAVVDRRIRVPVGATVHAHLRPSQTHIFDEAGQRLMLEGQRERLPA
jgi:ABC-type sugar transport system ATPase subunit